MAADASHARAVGGYRLLTEMGAGGMGVVHRARNPAIQREVAVKLLRAQLVDDPHARERFRRELAALACLSHPHIVQLLDFGTADDGTPFLVMELVEGPSLAAVLTQDAPLATERVVDLGRQLTRALAAAHARGIVHRDVKPSNILLQPDPAGRGPILKLLDFGICKIIEDTLDTQLTADRVVGSPVYTSPEQARGEPVDATCDLYSLGAVLYHALSGSPPFAAETPMGLLYHHVHTLPAQLPSRVPTAPPWLCELVMALLSKRPEDRPASARTVLDAFDTAQSAPHAVDSPRSAVRVPWWSVPLSAAAGAALTLAFLTSPAPPPVLTPTRATSPRPLSLASTPPPLRPRAVSAPVGRPRVATLPREDSAEPAGPAIATSPTTAPAEPTLSKPARGRKAASVAAPKSPDEVAPSTSTVSLPDAVTAPATAWPRAERLQSRRLAETR